MTDHIHTWAPIPLATARYECPCGATGRREKSGAIVEQKTDRRRKSRDAAPGGWLVEKKRGAE
jgi:hypothetical protein